MSAGWLFSRYKQVARDRWETWREQVNATEIALSRTLAASFSKNAKLEPLPEWETLEAKPNEQAKSLAFISKIEQANKKHAG